MKITSERNSKIIKANQPIFDKDNFGKHPNKIKN